MLRKTTSLRLSHLGSAFSTRSLSIPALPPNPPPPNPTTSTILVDSLWAELPNKFPPRRYPAFEEKAKTRPPFQNDSEYTLTRSPQPGLSTGLNGSSGAEDFEPSRAKWRSIDPQETKKLDIYKLMISAIAPRPIALVSTVSKSGVHNLAPMSWFNMVAHDPPSVMLSIQCKPGSQMKDSNSNIHETREFCISSVSEPYVESANMAATDAPPDVDEWKLANLTKRKSDLVTPPHVAEAAFSMECEVSHWNEVRNDEGDLTYTVVLGRVKRFHVKEFALDPKDGFKLEMGKLRPVSRLGGMSYGRTLAGYEIMRIPWDKKLDGITDETLLASASCALAAMYHL